jgi:hypothetical protein
MALHQRWTGGERPTATKLNETSIPVVATTADISAPYTGQIVFATSDTRLYRYTGSAWAKFSSGPSWSIFRATAQTIGNTAWTFVNWDDETDGFDTDNMHSTSVNPFAVTISTPGQYAVTAKNGMAPVGAPAASAIRGVRANKNGAVVRGSSVLTPVGGSTFTSVAVTPTLFIQCAIGDVLGIEIFHNHGANLATSTASAADYPMFTGTWLRD